MTWRCAWCGKPHDSDDPPCERCGYNSFNRADDAGGDADQGGTSPTYVWACTNCGREHTRNSPPCARCGNHTLEKTEQTFDEADSDLEVASWLEVAKPYSPFIAVFVLIVALFATGIVPASVLPGIGTDVPGEATEANGIDLDETALLVHDRLTDERQAATETETSDGTGVGAPLEYDEGLEEFATAENQRLVVSAYTDDDGGDRTDPSAFDLPCESAPQGIQVLAQDSIDAYDTEAALADDLATNLLESLDSQEVGQGDHDAEGIDIHVGPDGSILVVYVVC
ncbi:hypothetical protein HALLA_11575 [Halostagnicola larsenii XH-48]|uniref:Uncharacterized protein n=1 Tax=Halostagnicola larsenii XH-48 TaxID=797299 RepID=W0JLE6_9EURY|nr:hypothetical protein [Halostagnicola larsenii]AHF99408.1 hypothetical protein HALLA_11575 [Halostagnicola larsenii XH-48]